MADFLRQLDILPPTALVHPLTFIGLGGIGSPTVYTARKMGFKSFTLWDPDIVVSHNLPSQHFDRDDLGKSKVEGAGRQVRSSLDEDCRITTRQEEFVRAETLEGIVISGVDTMSARQEIWAAVQRSKPFVPLYIDGRVGVEWDSDQGKVVGEWIEVFTLVPTRISDCELYEPHLFSDDEAEPLRCTAQAVAYIGPLIAGFICANLKKWIMQETYPRHLLYDCLTNQFVVNIM